MIRMVLAALLLVFTAVLRPAAAIEVERVLSPGGIEAWLVRDHANPIIAVSIAWRGGGGLDPAGKEGLARMVSATLDEGAGDLDSQAFQRRLEDLAVSLRFDAGYDSFSGRLKTLTRNRDAAFELMRLAVTAPRFDAEPVERIRGQIVAGLRRDSEDPDTIARRTMSRTLFSGHPYGRPTRGTEQSVAAIGVDDLRKFTAQRLARDNMVIGVVGDIEPETLAGLLDGTFGGLPARALPWALPEVEPAATGKVIVVKKNVPQSVIVFAHGGLKRDHPDYYTAVVMNYILGGGTFASRLHHEVREKRGLAYSVYSALYPYDHAAMIWGGAGTANARVGETVGVVRDEWRRMAIEGVGETELADAKTYLSGSFPLRFSSSGRIASILVAMQLDDLGIDYLERRNGLIEAVTRDGVNGVARHLLDPEKLTMVVVGQPEGLPGE
jgi:zinc protease